jgi:hypothetical protein
MIHDGKISPDSALIHLSSESNAGLGVPDEFLPDSARESDAAPLPELNDAEAGNIAFILSDRISRSSALRMMNEDSASEMDMAKLAERVGRRLNELSLRLDGTS